MISRLGDLLWELRYEMRHSKPVGVICLLAAAFVAAWALARLLGLEPGWPLVPLLSLTPYVAALSLPLLAGILLAGRWRAAAVTALAAAGLLAAVLPRTFSQEQPPVRGPELRVMSANLLQGSVRLGDLERALRADDVEVLSVQELTPGAASAIAASGIAELLPHSVTESLDGSAGIGLYSRYPLRPASREPVPGAPHPPLGAAVEVPGAAPLELVAIHPSPPTSPASAAALGRYLEALPAADPASAPRVLVGDFNSTLDNKRFRGLLDRGYRDVAATLGSGLTATWPSGRIPPPVAIDHVVIDAGRIAALDFEVSDLPGSDHRLVYAELRVPGGGVGAVGRQASPDPAGG